MNITTFNATSSHPSLAALLMPAPRRKRKNAAKSSVDPQALKEVRPYDVLCGRCSTCFNNIGNRRFRITITMNVPNYLKAHTKPDKSIIIQSIIDSIQSAGGRFLKPKAGGFVVLSESKVREKVGHALRDLSVMTNSRDGQKLGSPVKRMPLGVLVPVATTRSSPATDNLEPISIDSRQSHELKEVPFLSVVEGRPSSTAIALPELDKQATRRVYVKQPHTNVTALTGRRSIRGPPPMSDLMANGSTDGPTTEGVHTTGGKMTSDDFFMFFDDLIGLCESHGKTDGDMEGIHVDGKVTPTTEQAPPATMVSQSLAVVAKKI